MDTYRAEFELLDNAIELQRWLRNDLSELECDPNSHEWTKEKFNQADEIVRLLQQLRVLLASRVGSDIA